MQCKTWQTCLEMQTTYPLKIQAIRSQGQQLRLYVSFPLALAAAIGLNPGDQVQWELLDRGELHLVRLEPPPRWRSRGVYRVCSREVDHLTARGLAFQGGGGTGA
jgi:hypothetical protein